MTRTKEVYSKYFSKENLQLAWERMIRSNKSDVKDLFGIEIYSANLNDNLERLSNIIIHGNYKPSRPFKYYEPKPSKTHRTKTVLSIEDAIVYQAIADKIATENYERLAENNSFVFGNVLHREVQEGTNILNNPDAEYYFFEYYIPLYNKFISSVNREIENPEIQYMLGTDITGFFDSIPHSKLLITLHQFGMEPEVLDLLGECLNIYSGTKESITPGVGLPQGPAASFLFANIFLNELDYIISQNGYTYYRYMDDIRIYEESEGHLTEALVLIDNYLKRKALSLNTKKTSIEEIGDNRESKKMDLLSGYEEHGEYGVETTSLMEIFIKSDDQNSNSSQNKSYLIKTIKGAELIDFCKTEVYETEKYLLDKFKNIGASDFRPRDITQEENLKKDIVHIAYRWRNANSILKNKDVPILNKNLIPIWMFCLEHFFWKANHFCWNLNQYGASSKIQNGLEKLLPKFKSYEWVRFQILSNLSMNQKFTSSKLKALFRIVKNEESSLVRLGYYMILVKHVHIENELYASLKMAIKDDKEPFIKNRLLSLILYKKELGDIDEIKYCFGL